MFRLIAFSLFLLVFAAPALAALTPSGPGRVTLKEAGKDKQFRGTVHWSSETSTGSDGKPEVAARADIVVPDRQMKVRMLFQSSRGPGLLGLTVQVSFEVPSDFAGGKGISELGRMAMKQTEQTIGIPFAGAAAQKVRNGVFLLGIARSDLENDARLYRRQDYDWISIPIVYGDKQNALLFVEKGHDGQQALAAMDQQAPPLPAAGNEQIQQPVTPAASDAAPARKEAKLDQGRTAALLELLDKQAEQKRLAQDPVAEALKNAPQKDRDPVKTRLDFIQSIDNVRNALSKCWHPDKHFKGSLRYRVILDKDGTPSKILPFVENKNDNGIDRVALSAIRSCQPYAIPTAYPNWNFFEVLLSQQVEIISLASIPSEQAAKIKALIADDSANLTRQDIAKLTAQVTACVKTTDFEHKSETEIQLDLNPDGSVAPSSKILSSATPDIGRNLLLATFQCQPYLLPAEKYQAWKSLILVFAAKKT